MIRDAASPRARKGDDEPRPEGEEVSPRERPWLGAALRLGEDVGASRAAVALTNTP